MTDTDKMHLWQKLPILRIAFVAALIAVSSGCEKGANVADTLVEARTAAWQGETDQAIALYEQVLEMDSGNVPALLGLADIHIEAGDLDAAQGRFETLAGLELDTGDEQRVSQARLRLWQLVYEQTKGDGPTNPADPAQYEEALIALFNDDSTPELAQEVSERLVFLARQAIGAADPTAPQALDPSTIQGATLEQLNAGREAYRLMTERDPRLRRVLVLPEEIRNEAEGMIVLIGVRIFDIGFTELFNTSVREELVQLEGFLPDANRFRLFLQTEIEGEAPDGEAMDSFRNSQALMLVAQNMNDLGFRIRGDSVSDVQAPSARIYGQTPVEVAQFFAGFEVANFELTRRGQLTLEVLVPFHVLLKTAFRQQEYIDWYRTRPTEGTGSAAEPDSPPLEGSGAPVTE